MRYLVAMPALLLAAPLGAAPLVDLYGGVFSGQTALSGTLSSGPGQADIEQDLGFDDTRQTVVYLGLEHPVPVLPNVRLRYTRLAEEANGQVQTAFVFDGQAFAPGTPVVSSVELEYTDLTLYYTPLDLAVKVDLGLTARQVRGEFQVQNRLLPANRGEQTVDEVLPLVHVGVYGKLPLTGFYANGELNGVALEGDSMVDARAGIGWVSNLLLGVELGYQLQQVDAELGNLTLDTDAGGPYLAVSLNF